MIDRPRIPVATELTAFQWCILSILSERPRNGLAVKDELDAYYDEKINANRLYPNLDTLVEYGLVSKHERDKRTNEYILTKRGDDVLLAKIEWKLSKLCVEAEHIERIRDILE
ncbi:MAG: helix-turn-helix transcriptional regulator [Natronomonas sp.]